MGPALGLANVLQQSKSARVIGTFSNAEKRLDSIVDYWLNQDLGMLHNMSNFIWIHVF
jgi:hypothetical protein